jgi:hypothetical protein
MTPVQVRMYLPEAEKQSKTFGTMEEALAYAAKRRRGEE